ncbi:MAG: methyltransferase domain-containing protein, partial [Vicinamibacterales bacterium]
AVEAAQKNVGHRPGVDVIQADVFHLPFRDEVFDVIVSLGVLHHTRDTREAFLSLPRHVKEGGTIAVWLYYYTDWLYNRATDFWRAVLRALPNRAIYWWSACITAIFYPLYRQPFMRVRPFSLLPRMLPVNMHTDWHWRVLDTFDWYSPVYQDKACSPTRVVGWCREGSLRDAEILDFPTSVRAVKDRLGVRPLFKGLPDLRHKRIVIFGAGAGGQQALDRLAAIGVAHQVVGVVDNDPAKRGLRLGGHLVTTLADLPRDAYDHVVIASLPGLPAIATQLRGFGLVETRDFFASGILEEFAPELRLASR